MALAVAFEVLVEEVRGGGRDVATSLLEMEEVEEVEEGGGGCE